MEEKKKRPQERTPWEETQLVWPKITKGKAHDRKGNLAIFGKKNLSQEDQTSRSCGLQGGSEKTGKRKESGKGDPRRKRVQRRKAIEKGNQQVKKRGRTHV